MHTSIGWMHSRGDDDDVQPKSRKFCSTPNRSIDRSHNLDVNQAFQQSQVGSNGDVEHDELESRHHGAFEEEEKEDTWIGHELVLLYVKYL